MPNMEFNGARVAYSESGSGEPVIALHSSASSSVQWKAFHQGMGSRFHVLTPDLCGYGDSDGWRGDGPISLAREADRIAAIMDRLVEPVHLVGHSYGGAVALRLAMDKPHRVRSLTLIEPVAFQVLRQGEDPDRILFSEISGIAGAVSDAVTSGNFHKGMARFVDYWNGPGTWRRLDTDRQHALMRLTPKLALDFWAACTDPARHEDYRHLHTPTLILRGDLSPPPVRRIAELLAAQLPTARLETIDGAGHMLPLTHPAPVMRLAQRHLQSHPSRHRYAA